MFVRDAVPGDRVRARRDQAQEGLRRGAHRRAARARPRPHRRRSRRTRARRGRCCPTSASSRSRPSRSTTRCGGSAGSTASSSSRSCPPSSSGATATSSSTRSAPATTASWSAASTRRARGSASSTSRTACWPPSAATRRGARRCGGAASAACAAYDRRAQTGLLRNLVVREGRRTGELQVRLVTSDEARSTSTASPRRSAPAASLWTRALDVGETTAGGETEVLHGTEAIEEELGGLRFRVSADAFFQTNTEMAERLYAVAGRATPALQGWERVYDLFCGIGTIGLSLAPRAGEVWGLEIVEEAIADAIANARAQRDRQRALLRRRRAPRACASSSRRPGAPDVVVVDPPRAGLSAKVVRRVIEAGADADRLRLLQPDDARAQRRPARRGRLRAAPRAPGRHVPADAAHRVRRAARARLTPAVGPPARVVAAGVVDRLLDALEDARAAR